MPLQLTLRATTNIPLEVPGLIPTWARDQSSAKIERFEIFHGNTKTPLGEFFRVSGSARDDETIVLGGDCSGVHWLGQNMAGGTIRVEGAIGRHLGSEMRGGMIEVAGNASDWVGSEMRGGFIRVRGHAGNEVGAAYRGSRRGMRQGTILIHGSAGHEIGHTMRRGLIAIGGNVGNFVGFNMLAGTILVFGNAGVRHGSGMKRGTLGFFGSHRPELLPSFRAACRYRPPYLPLLAKQLASWNFPVNTDRLRDACELHCGDILEGGRGEILWPVSLA